MNQLHTINCACQFVKLSKNAKLLLIKLKKNFFLQNWFIFNLYISRYE